MKLNLELAEKIIAAAMKKAEEMEVPQCIAIVDTGGHLVAFKRMDGAPYVGVNIAIDKAYTSGAGFPTDVLGQIGQPGEFAYGIANTDRGRIMIFAGGLPIKSGEELIGGIGVAGGSAPEDKKVAEAGLSALK